MIRAEDIGGRPAGCVTAAPPTRWPICCPNYNLSQQNIRFPIIQLSSHAFRDLFRLGQGSGQTRSTAALDSVAFIFQWLESLDLLSAHVTASLIQPAWMNRDIGTCFYITFSYRWLTQHPAARRSTIGHPTSSSILLNFRHFVARCEHYHSPAINLTP